MKKEVLDFMVEKTKELVSAVTCSPETKAAAQIWLDAVGTDNESSATITYMAELEADIMPIDTLIGFAESEAGASGFDLFRVSGHLFGFVRSKHLGAGF